MLEQLDGQLQVQRLMQEQHRRLPDPRWTEAKREGSDGKRLALLQHQFLEMPCCCSCRRRRAGSSRGALRVDLTGCQKGYKAQPATEVFARCWHLK